MQLLLCAATAAEVETTVAVRKQSGKRKVDCIVTGVGLMAATFHLQEQLLKKKYDFVIQAGVAGSCALQLAPGAVAVVGKDCVGDEGVWEGENFKNVFDLGLRPDAPPYQQYWLANPDTDLSGYGLPVVTAATVNQISTDKKMIRHLSHIGASLESMEGAALHYVCLKKGVPFLQLRAVSNVIGERDKSQWHMGLALNNLNRELQRILNKLLHEQN